MSNHKSFVVIPLVFVLVASTVSAESPQLNQGELVDEAAVIRQLENPSSKDLEFAKESLEYARRASSQGRWGAAFKAYGEAAMIAPSVDSFLGLSVAAAKTPRKRENCSEELAAKTSDLSLSVQYLAVATAVLRRTERTSSRKWEDVAAAYTEVFAAHRSLLHLHRNCQP